MGPVPSVKNSSLRGIHYFVDENGCFQSYEYATCDIPNMSGYETFLAEFSQIVIERSLQHIFGLKLDNKEEVTGWTEFEFPDKRSTIIIPRGMPMPETEDRISVTTEWGKSDDGIVKRGCSHCSHVRTCNHNKMPSCGAEMLEESEFYLGGQRIDAGSPVYPILNAVLEVW